MVGVESADITQNDERFDDAAVDDDWQLPLDFHLFANFVPHKVYYSATSYFTIDCVESLTPIDMTSLSSGAHDATGLCAWRGAFLLVAMMDALQDFVTGNRNVLELGSGTGVGGIALLKAGLASTLCFSDADPAANQLCRRNCVTNKLPLSSYRIEELHWGETLPLTIQAASFDAVVAADVIYDIELLSICLQSAADCVRVDGYLILSHVPRACCKANQSAGDESLEQFIVRRATQVGFELATILQPTRDAETWIAPSDSLNRLIGGTFEDMVEVDALILVFQKK